ncbi:YfhD family protein [Peribacillus sp. JNUCC 23]|uniref:YfhD family protein n=1 Tax=Peribacillus TaxID=2675229 RepID=UPI0009E5757B|nr:YfhD family protein [Peribacillus loiseleuriae]
MAKELNQQSVQRFKNQKSDGLDIEFSQELADHDDLEAQQRSQAADKRAKQKRNTH